MPAHRLHHDKELCSQINPYAASQPGIIRKALSALGTVDEYGFCDLGCGKGRVLFVASEFPFRELTGVELSPDLVKTAQANAAIMAARYPHRLRVNVVEANVVKYRFTSGRLVIFIYHAFGRELMSQVVQRLERALGEQIEHLFVVYYNPVHGDVLDASPAFSRWFAASLAYDEAELGHGPDTTDTVVIWQSRKGSRPTPHAEAGRGLAVQHAFRVELGD